MDNLGPQVLSHFDNFNHVGIFVKRIHIGKGSMRTLRLSFQPVCERSMYSTYSSNGHDGIADVRSSGFKPAYVYANPLSPQLTRDGNNTKISLGQEARYTQP